MRITLIVGPQASGKTTLAKAIAGKSSVHIDADMPLRYRWEFCTPFTKSVVIDALHTEEHFEWLFTLSTLHCITVYNKSGVSFQLTPWIIAVGQQTLDQLPNYIRTNKNITIIQSAKQPIA